MQGIGVAKHNVGSLQPITGGGGVAPPAKHGGWLAYCSAPLQGDTKERLATVWIASARHPLWGGGGKVRKRRIKKGDMV